MLKIEISCTIINPQTHEKGKSVLNAFSDNIIMDSLSNVLLCKSLFLKTLHLLIH